MQSLFYGTPEDNDDPANNPSYSGATNEPASSFGGFGLGTAAKPTANAPASGGAGFAQEVGFHIENCSSVKEYAYTEDKNRQFRPQMEDTCCHKDKLCNDQTCGLFAVFDGHGGRQVSEHCSETFALELKKEMQINSSDMYKVFENVFQKIDK